MYHIVDRRMAAIYKWLVVNSNNILFDLFNGDRYKEHCLNGLSFLLTVNGDIFLSTLVY